MISASASTESESYAFVKFLEDGDTLVVAIVDIKKFTVESWKLDMSRFFKTKWADGRYYKALVVCLGDSPDDAYRKQEAMGRIRLPNIKYCMPESDTSEIENVYPKATSEAAATEKSGKRTASGKKKADANAAVHANFNRIYTDCNAKTSKVEGLGRRDELQEKNGQLQEKNEKLQEKNKVLQERNEELQKRSEELHKMNKELQKKVIDKFEDFEKKLSVAATNEVRAPKDEETAIGNRKNGQVHLGRGVFLPIHIFDSIDARGPKKDGLFVKELAAAVFGNKVLAESSVTGASNNKYHSAPKPPLDATKRLAICDILRYRMAARGCTEDQINKMILQVNHKIGEKIQDIIRPPNRKAKKCDEAGEQIGDEEVTDNEEVANGDIVVRRACVGGRISGVGDGKPVCSGKAKEAEDLLQQEIHPFSFTWSARASARLGAMITVQVKW